MPIENEDVLERAPIPPLRYVDGHEVETVSYQQFDYRSEADRIGEGYEADVYAAELAPTNRTVAVKRVPKRRTTSREQVEKLMRGAELGQSICDHPYIATIYEYDHRPYPWIALEHVGGGHLDRNRDDMSLEQRLWTAYAIVDAVAHANTNGVGHHDLTPSNVLLSRTPGDLWPAPKLVDWGEAQELQADRRPERITEDYAAPEMREGRLPGESLGAQTDAYQVAVVCYELLTGTLPNHPGRSVRPPSAIGPTPPALDEPLQRALSMDPDRRQHPISLRDDLERALTAQLEASVDAGTRSSHRGRDAAGGRAASGTEPQGEWRVSDRETGRGSTRDGRGRKEESPQRGGEARGVSTTAAGETSKKSAGTVRETPRESPEAIRETPESDSAARLDADGAWPAFRGSGRRTGRASCGPVTALSPKWHYETDREVRSSPAVADGTVFVGCRDGTLYALDARTGEMAWSKVFDSAVRSSPAVSQEAVYVGSKDTSVYALGRRDGKRLWEFETDGWVDSSPVVRDGTVYVGSDDFRLYAIDAADGSLQWEYDTDGEVGASSPAIHDETVYVAGNSGKLHAVDAQTGLRKWCFETQFMLQSTPAVADGRVYVGGSQNRLYAVSADDGSREWSVATGGDVRTSPAVAEETVVFGSDDGNVYAVDAETGEQRWRRVTENWVRCSPTVASGTVVVGGNAGSLYLFGLSDGSVINSFDINEWIESSPAVAESGVFVGSESGVRAFGTGE